MMPGQSSATEIIPTIIDDSSLEQFEEVFVIRMELVDSSSSSVTLIDNEKQIRIQDNDGWLCRACFLLNNYF